MLLWLMKRFQSLTHISRIFIFMNVFHLPSINEICVGLKLCVWILFFFLIVLFTFWLYSTNDGRPVIMYRNHGIISSPWLCKFLANEVWSSCWDSSCWQFKALSGCGFGPTTEKCLLYFEITENTQLHLQNSTKQSYFTIMWSTITSLMSEDMLFRCMLSGWISWFFMYCLISSNIETNVFSCIQ